MKTIEEIVKDNEYALIEEKDLIKLLEKVSLIYPKVILEIGTRQGFSFQAFIEAFEPELAITIDILQKEEMPAHNIIPILSWCHYLWGCDSNSIETLTKVKNLLNNRQVDFLFIDGDHSLETVTKDWELYSPLLREGGIIAF